MWVFRIVLFTAAFSPTADPLTMMLLAVPLCLLYFSAGGIAVLIDRRRDKRLLNVETKVSAIESATSIEE